MKASVFLSALVFAFVTTSAMAQQQQRSGTKQEQEACTRDVTRYCRKVMDQGDFVILGCLKENRSRLTKACQQVLASHGQ